MSICVDKSNAFLSDTAAKLLKSLQKPSFHIKLGLAPINKHAATKAAFSSSQKILQFEEAVKAVDLQREALREEEAYKAQTGELKQQREEERIAELHRQLSKERAEAELERALKRTGEEM
jgi:hypothetical protein